MVRFDPLSKTERQYIQDIEACPQATSGSASFGDPPSDPEDREKYLRFLEEAGANVHRLENGGALLSQPTGARLYAGTTTGQSTKPISEPVFQVTGAANTAYLRTCVGDLYEQGRWAQLDPIALPYSAEGRIGELVREAARQHDRRFRSVARLEA